MTSEVERYRAVVDDGPPVWPSLPLPVTPGLPLPALADDLATTDARLVVTAVDRDGRLADRSPVIYVGWSAGETVQLHVEPGPVILVRPGAGIPLTPRGHLRLPVSVRRRCRIAVGDRLLVVAHQRPGELLVVVTATVDVLVTTLLRDAGQAGR
jgi:hypothetical protein